MKKKKLFQNDIQLDGFKDANPEKLPKKYYRELVIHFRNYSDKELFEEKTGLLLKENKSIIYHPNKNNKLFNNINKNISVKIEEFKKINPWDEYYTNMPEYLCNDCNGIVCKLIFENKDDVDYFQKFIDTKLTEKTKYIWFPKNEKNHWGSKVWRTKEDIQPRFPIFIVSKGRASINATAKYLIWMGIKLFFLIVEEQEYDDYLKYFDKEHLLILPKEYQEKYETVDPEGDEMELPVGSGAARNFAWDYSIKLGFDYHWVMDDNILGFFRFNDNRFYKVKSGAYFRVMEDFVTRYENITMAGPNYQKFVTGNDIHEPITWNTRIYSCNLIKNNSPYRWRCRYNEDTDLSVRMLKDGNCLALFNSFPNDKATTKQFKGGNTDTIYQIGTGVKSRALARLHPDVTQVVYKFSRIHHYIDYRKFKNKPELKSEIKDTNNYKFYLDDIKDGELFVDWVKEYNKKRGIINE